MGGTFHGFIYRVDYRKLNRVKIVDLAFIAWVEPHKMEPRSL